METTKIITPRELSMERLELSQQYSEYAGKLARLLKVEADFFNQNRGKHKSDNATQKVFDATPDGVSMNAIKIKLKSIDKRISAIAMHFKLLENEAKNIY